MNFEGTIIITDPCYIIKDEDWDGEDTNLRKLGFTNYIFRNTIYGDWSCTTFKTDYEEPFDIINNRMYFGKYYELFTTAKSIGEFCADSGMVCVFLAKEINKYNPNFVEWAKEHRWCATIITNFSGEVEEYVVGGALHLIGQGNVNFFTIQTSY